MLEYLRSTPPLWATLSLRSIFAPKTAPSVSTAVMIDGKNGLLGGRRLCDICELGRCYGGEEVLMDLTPKLGLGRLTTTVRKCEIKSLPCSVVGWSSNFRDF